MSLKLTFVTFLPILFQSKSVVTSTVVAPIHVDAHLRARMNARLTLIYV